HPPSPPGPREPRGEGRRRGRINQGDLKMPVVPNSRLGKIEFYEARLTPWENHAVAIGLSTAQVAALEVHVQAARAAYNAHLAARDAALAATQEFYNKVRAMHNAPGAGADMIRKIKN